MAKKRKKAKAKKSKAKRAAPARKKKGMKKAARKSAKKSVQTATDGIPVRFTGGRPRSAGGLFFGASGMGRAEGGR